MRKALVSAPAKIHLSGEHSVVYNQPALLAAIDLRCRVKGEWGGQQICLSDRRLNQREQISWVQLDSFGRQIEEAWKMFLAGGPGYWVALKGDPFGLLKVAVFEFYRWLGQPPKSGFRLEIDSKIPSGSGLGSSAALAAATVRVLGKLEEVEWTEAELNKIVYEVEKRQHGRPSGGDNAVVVVGGLVWFQKKTGSQPFGQDLGKTPSFWLIDSGQPQETTGQMVALVSRLEGEKRELLVEKMGQVTGKIKGIFEKRQFERLAALIQANHHLLVELGVVGSRALAMIARIEKAGGSAKVCGAGGAEDGSGLILALGLTKVKIKNILGPEVNCW
ncbi:mevalonate kinase, partial [Patescibacteria group bacterium]|nr:mevalonate kinase [Patescibacteria group bacterium]